ncbi:MAG: hypothetical protein RIB98_07125 [Acidimicrobiales bacterium]
MSADETLDRIAHAFNPAEWRGRSLVIAIVVFVFVAVVTVVQRALVSDSTMAWVITGIHGALVAVVVPLLVRRTVREWRAAQPSGVPE